MNGESILGAGTEHGGDLEPGDAAGRGEQQAYPEPTGEQAGNHQGDEHPPGSQAGETLASFRLPGIPQGDEAAYRSGD